MLCVHFIKNMAWIPCVDQNAFTAFLRFRVIGSRILSLVLDAIIFVLIVDIVFPYIVAVIVLLKLPHDLYHLRMLDFCSVEEVGIAAFGPFDQQAEDRPDDQGHHTPKEYEGNDRDHLFLKRLF